MPGLALDAALVSITTDISIDTPGSRDRGSDNDPNRREMAWANRLEDLVHDTRKASSASAASHETAAKRARKLYQLFGLPTVIIPLAGSVAVQYLPESAITAMLLASGVCAAISAFLNLGQKAQLHNEYSARWMELSSTISFEMAKGRADRCAADVFLERLRNRTAALRAAEPPD